MKQILLSTALAGLLLGCASTETGRVHHTPEGTRVYGFDEQPQTAVAGEGSLMPGAYGSRPDTGEFTGKERTVDQIGQATDLPREADPRVMSRSTETGAGAGTLGQTGVIPGREVSTSTILGPVTNAVGSAPGPERGATAGTNNPPPDPMP